MKKRILSIVLAVLMLVSVLPVTAMAATMGSPQTDTGAARQLSVSNATDDDSVHIVKSVNEAGTALTLEAYATNTMTTVTTYEPLDIVLVLDVSGSMDDEIDTYTYKKVENKTKWSCKDIYNNGKYGYYIQKSDSSYQAVSYSSRLTLNGRRYWATAGGQAIGSEAKWDETSYSGELYTRQFEKREKKIVALKRAVNAFIDNVAAQKDSDGNTIDNRISLVTFASNANTVKGLTSAQSGSAELKAAVKGLTANGATQADLGMKRAQSVLDGRTGDDANRKSVVIMFTDGEPTSGSSFESSVASGAITAAKDLKAGGTTIFTVGIFEGANPSASVTASSTSKTNKYMHAVSSNYPTAAYIEPKEWWSTSWDWSFGERAKDSNYYLAASNAGDLDDVFQAISQEIGSLKAKVDASSVLSDTLSDMFDFDPVTGDVADSITVKKVPVTGKDANGNYTWGKPEDVTGVTVSVDAANPKKLNVTGFDYAANAVTASTDGKYTGSKLVVTIPIKPDTGYTDWKYGPHDYPTNDTDESKAGLSYGENGEHKLELDNSPQVPVTGYKVEYKFQGDVPSGVIAPTDSEVYIEGQTAQVLRVDSPVNGQKDGQDGKWTFSGWKNGGNDAGEKITINDDVTLTGTWSFEALPQPGLRVTKTAMVNGEELSEGEKAKVGDTITYTITVTNTGNTTLTGVKVEDTFEAGAADTLSFTGNGLPQNATLEPGQTISITATYVVVEADYGKTIKNTAVATADDDTTESDEVTTKVDPKTEPPHTEYKIELTISKELRLRSGSHPGARTFWFNVSYYAGDDVFRHAGEFSITLADGEFKKQENVSVTVDEDAYDAILGGASVRVVEQDLDENGFEYDTTPGLGAAVVFWVDTTTNIVDTSNVRPTDNTLYITPFPQAGNDFDFVNYYGKSGKVEKPVKVGPQLNRDDHVAYIMGYPDGTVQPEGEITRAEACTIFFRLLTDSSRDYYFARTNDYSDVNAGDWFNNAISTLSNAGIVTGYNDGTFRPNQPITRGEMAKIIANFANLKYGGKTFTDLAGHWSKSYVELAAGNGWIAGYPDGSFRPDQKITRAETVTMINRVLDRVPAKESRLLSRSIMLTFPDNNPGDWYYIAIQEASNSHEYQRSVYETTGDEMWTKLIDNVDWTKLEK